MSVSRRILDDFAVGTSSSPDHFDVASRQQTNPTRCAATTEAVHVHTPTLKVSHQAGQAANHHVEGGPWAAVWRNH